jgi:hypothetical protein
MEDSRVSLLGGGSGGSGGSSGTNESYQSMNVTPVLSQTATGAIVTGAVLGTLILGPVGGLAIGGAITGASLAFGQADGKHRRFFVSPYFLSLLFGLQSKPKVKRSTLYYQNLDG